MNHKFGVKKFYNVKDIEQAAEITNLELNKIS